MTRRTLYFTAERRVEVRDRPIPEPEAGEVLVETAVSAISAGTELLIYRGEAPERLRADETLPSLDGDLSYPLAYGYAAVGEVIEAGPDASADWVGRTVFAFNPHETHFTARPGDLVAVPDDVSAEGATLLPTVETATNFVLDGAPLVGERVVVFGAGLVGLCTTNALAEFPLDSLVVVEPVAERRALAERFGADEAVAPAAFTRPDGPGPAGADLAFELSGAPAALDDAVAAVGYDGRVVVGSWYGTEPVELDLGGRFHRDRIAVESSQVSTVSPDLGGRWTSERRLRTALDRLGDLETDDLIADRLPFADAEAAYRRLDDDHPPGGILLTYDR